MPTKKLDYVKCVYKLLSITIKEQVCQIRKDKK